MGTGRSMRVKLTPDYADSLGRRMALTQNQSSSREWNSDAYHRLSELRTEFMAELTDRASADTPPFSLDYWRVNLRGHALRRNARLSWTSLPPYRIRPSRSWFEPFISRRPENRDKPVTLLR